MDSTFPPEIIIIILSWLPIKCLLRFRSVCKEWLALTCERYFIEKQMDNNGVWQHCFNVLRPPPPVPEINGQGSLISNDDHNLCYHYSCDGLLLMMKSSGPKFWLWNPAVRKSFELPNTRSDTLTMALAYVPATLNYKVVSVYYNRLSGLGGWEVFIPGQDKDWKHIAFPNNICMKSMVIQVRSGTTVHSVIDFQEKGEFMGNILSFDMETEEFTQTLVTWERLKNMKNGSYCMDWDGKLGFVDLDGHNLHVMELKDHKEQRWSDEKQIIPLPFMKEATYVGRQIFPLFKRGDEIWFWVKDMKLFRYSTQTGQCTDVENSDKFWYPLHMHRYKPSLVTFQGMVVDTRFTHIFLPL